MSSKMDSKSAISGTKDPLQFPNLIIGRLPERKDELENQALFFKRNFGHRNQPAHEEKIHCIAWNKDGTLLATGSYDKTVVLFAFKDGKMFREYSLKGHNHSVDLLDWHPLKPDLLLTYSNDRTVRLWNVRQRSILQSYAVKGEAVSMRWAPDGKSFAVGDKDDTLTFIETEKGHKFEQKFNYEVNDMVFRRHGDRTYLFLTTGLSVFPSGRLEYFEYKFPELTPIHVIPVSSQAVTTVDIDPAGRYLGVAGVDSNITVLDLNGLFPVQEITRHKQAIRRLSFSHDSRYIASMADGDSYIDVALAETGEKVWDFHNDERDDRESISLIELTFHPKKLILAAAYDCKRNHKDASFIRLFGVVSVPETEKRTDSGQESRARSRERERVVKEDTKDLVPAVPVKPKFVSKFSFLQPTASQQAGLDERKAAQAARDAKAAQIAAARAQAQAAKLPVRVATRLGVQAQQAARSGIRAPIRAPSATGAPTSPSVSRTNSPSISRDNSGSRKDDDRKQPMAPPAAGNNNSGRDSPAQSRSSANGRRGDTEDQGPDRQRVRSSNRDAEVKDRSSSSPAAHNRRK